MIKIKNKTGLVISGAALAFGILAVPVLAGNNSKTEIQANVAPVAVSSPTSKL